MTFLSGFQNKNINGSHHILAFITSIFLGIAGVLLYKVMPTASQHEMLAYISAGPVGVLLSMLVHDKFVKKTVSANCLGCKYRCQATGNYEEEVKD